MQRRVIPDVVRDQDLLTLPGSATVREAARLMTERGVRSVLVVDQAQLEGIFTDTDLIERVVAEGLDPASTVLSGVITRDPLTVVPDCLAIEALRLMHGEGCRHLPVVDAGRLVGVVSRRDFLLEEEDEIEREERLWERL